MAWPDVDVDDDALVARCVDGDRWARGALYRRYAEDVASLALRLLRDRDEAMDVLQDTFVTAFRTLPSLRHPSKVRAWLRTIAVRHVQRRFRRQRLRALLGFRRPALPLEELAACDASQDAVLELRRIDAVLTRLPDRARIVWTMRRVEGETLQAIADSLGVSLATVKRDVALAQATLDDLFAEETEPC